MTYNFKVQLTNLLYMNKYVSECIYAYICMCICIYSIYNSTTLKVEDGKCL